MSTDQKHQQKQRFTDQFKKDNFEAMREKPRRSRLISEMARDFSRHSDSVASSTGSKHGTVSPDSTLSSSGFSAVFNAGRNMSSRQYTDNSLSKQLPNIRDTAKKCGRWAPRPEPTPLIDTSALGRSFPDFTGGISSDDDYSAEIGRGGMPYTTSNSRNPKIYVDEEDVVSSPVVRFGNHEIVSTPKNPRARSLSKPVLLEVLDNNTKQNTLSSVNSFNVDKKESFFDIPPHRSWKKAQGENRSGNQQSTAEQGQNNSGRQSISPEQAQNTSDRQYINAEQINSVRKQISSVFQKSATLKQITTEYQNQADRADRAARQQETSTAASDSFALEKKENISPARNFSGSPYTSNASVAAQENPAALHARVTDQYTLADLSDFTTSSNDFHPSPNATSGSDQLRRQAQRTPFNLDDYARFLPGAPTPPGHRPLIPERIARELSVEKSRETSEEPINESSNARSVERSIGQSVEQSVEPANEQPNEPSNLSTVSSSFSPINLLDLPRQRPQAKVPEVARPVTRMCSRSSRSASVSSTSSSPSERVAQRARANSAESQKSKASTISTRANPTQASFVTPGVMASSSSNTATVEVGVPVSVQKKHVQHRNILQSNEPKFGPVDGFDLPGEEEDIYAMCDRQKLYIAELESLVAKNREEYESEDEHKVLTIVELGAEVSQLRKEKKRTQNIQNELAHVKKQCESIKAQNGELARENEEYKSHQCIDEADHAELQASHDDLKNQNDAFKHHQCVDEVLETRHAALQLEMAHLNMEKKIWRSHKCIDEKLEKEVSQLRLAKKALESHKCKEHELEEYNTQLQRALKAHTQIKIELTTRVHKVEKELKTQKQKEKGLEAQNIQFAKEIDIHQQKTTDLQKLKAQLDQEVKSFRSHKCSEHHSEAIEKQNAQLHEEIQSLKKHSNKHSIEALEQQNAQMHEEMQSLKKRYSKHNISAIEEQNAQLQADLKRMERHQTKYSEEITRLKTEKKTWESHRCVDSAIGDSASERDRDSSFLSQQEGDVTMRPTMSPLAAVKKLLHNVQDEIKALKAKLEKYTAVYSGHNAKIGRGERQKVEAMIKKLVDQISVKSDELYLLHDVELGLN